MGSQNLEPTKAFQVTTALSSLATVFVVDDDSSVRRSLTRLLKSAGYRVEAFSSAADFLASGRHSLSPACLVLDVRLPGLTGLDLQARLAELGSSLTIVFITGHADVLMSVRAMKVGAVDFLPKPFEDAQLLDAIATAVTKNIRDQRHHADMKSIRERYASLTPREQEVMALIVTGKLNKQVAVDLGTVEKTIKVHRARVLEKMKVDSLAELVPLAEKLGLLGES